MLASFAWGFAAAATLIVGGAFALRFPVGERALGMVMAFGSGVLISAVAFELVQEAFDKAGGGGSVALGLVAGSVVFYTGDTLIDRVGGGDRKHSGGRQAEGSALAIVLGIVLDGIPESIVLGLTIVVSGSVSAAFLVAVALSNVPEAIAASTGLAKAGWAERRILGLWSLVAVVSGLAALFGFVAVRFGAGRDRRVRALFRGRRDPDDARRHDDARGVRARREARRPGHDARLRARLRDQRPGLAHCVPRYPGFPTARRGTIHAS